MHLKGGTVMNFNFKDENGPIGVLKEVVKSFEGNTWQFFDDNGKEATLVRISEIEFMKVVEND